MLNKTIITTLWLALLSCSSFYSQEYKWLATNFMKDTAMFNPKLYHRYTDIHEASLQADSVRYLDLRSHNYRKFPIEILQFKNLEYLDLSNISLLVPLRRKKRIDARLKKVKNGNSTFTDDVPRRSDSKFITITPNRISSIPPEIGTLQLLKVLDLSTNRLHNLPLEIVKLKKLKYLRYGGQYNRLDDVILQLHQLIPNCEFL